MGQLIEFKLNAIKILNKTNVNITKSFIKIKTLFNGVKILNISI